MPWQIEDRLWVSGTPTARTMVQTGATAVVTVCRKRPEIIGTRDAPLRAWYHLPVKDGKSVQPDEYRRAAAIVKELLPGGAVLVNCLAGRNRSMLVAGLVLMELQGLDGHEVVERLRKIRPNCLHNPVLETWLRAQPRPT